MTKIYIIVDEDEKLKGFTSDRIVIQKLERGDDYYMCQDYARSDTYLFTTNHVTYDESPNLISIPDELLLRVRDHNIDIEHQHALEETQQLKEKIKSLKEQVYGWELRRSLVEEEWNRYNKLIDKAIDEHPEVAAEIALQDGNLEAACYFAAKANEEEN